MKVDDLLKALKSSKDMHGHLNKALQKLLESKEIRGYVFASFGGSSVTSWKASTDDILGTVEVLVESLTGDAKFSRAVCETIASHISVPPTEIN